MHVKRAENETELDTESDFNLNTYWLHVCKTCIR